MLYTGLCLVAEGRYMYSALPTLRMQLQGILQCLVFPVYYGVFVVEQPENQEALPCKLPSENLWECWLCHLLFLAWTRTFSQELPVRLAQRIVDFRAIDPSRLPSL